MISPPKAETKKLLLRAAEILEGGWCRGNYARHSSGAQIPIRLAQPGVDSFCLAGAIMKAVMEHEGHPDGMHSGSAGEHPLAREVFSALNLAVNRRGSGIGTLTTWNDTVCPSAEVAAAVVREVADDLGD